MTDREKALAYFRHREAQIPMPGARAMHQEAIKALEQPEIIRCKDCEKYGTMFCAIGIWTEDVTIYTAKTDDFCSKAERREG